MASRSPSAGPDRRPDATAASRDEAVPWLDEREMAIWRSFIEATGRVMHALGAQLKADAGMTFEDYEVLVHLSESSEHRLRMTDLSERLLHSQSRLTQRIDRLVRRGWVTREKCPEDRRGVFAVITPAGMDAIVGAAPGHVRAVREALVDLVEPAERPVVEAVLRRVAEVARAREPGAEHHHRDDEHAEATVTADDRRPAPRRQGS